MGAPKGALEAEHPLCVVNFIDMPRFFGPARSSFMTTAGRPRQRSAVPQEPVREKDPAPRRRPHEQERNGARDDPSEDEEQLASQRVGEATCDAIDGRLGDAENDDEGQNRGARGVMELALGDRGKMLRSMPTIAPTNVALQRRERYRQRTANVSGAIFLDGPHVEDGDVDSLHALDECASRPMGSTASRFSRIERVTCSTSVSRASARWRSD